MVSGVFHVLVELFQADQFMLHVQFINARYTAQPFTCAVLFEADHYEGQVLMCLPTSTSGHFCSLLCLHMINFNSLLNIINCITITGPPHS